VISDVLAEFSFRRTAHDRLAERRDDPAFLEQAWQDPKTRVLVMHRWTLATLGDRRGLRFVAPAEAPAGERMLLGAVDGVVHFLVLAETDGGDEEGFSGLREVATDLDEVEASLAVHAVSLAGWHLRHPKCSVCGADTRVVQAGESRRCPSCDALHFPRTDPAVIMLVVDDQDRCLLGSNAARPAGWYSTLAGFVEPGETPEQAVVREIKEEVGVDVDSVRYAGSQPWPFPSSLMLGFFAHASSTGISVDEREISEARWFNRAELAEAVEAGELGLPTTVSIAGALITTWYGGPLPPNKIGWSRG
jgi:NAD+ diphosphatase